MAWQRFRSIRRGYYNRRCCKIMRDKDISCVFVAPRVHLEQPIGVVTERDMLYRVLAEHRGPYKTSLRGIMSSPLITIEEESSISEAISLMRDKLIRRLPVKKGGRGENIVGIVTLMSIVGNTPSQSLDLAEIELPNDIIKITKIICLYCKSYFDKIEMSKHIDRVHVGSGLLEGDLREW
jgi:signal-transduction protein with cAMP-binding, CBS, and nucleotidyltransferase domain